jgi:4'-phosphopantetheinyl transferase
MRPLTLTASARAPGETSSEAAPARLALSPEVVDVWGAALDDLRDDVQQSLHAWLSREERARAQRFHFERDRRRYVAGRGVLRSLLGGYLDLAPEDIEFQYGPAGKPALAADPKRRQSAGGAATLHFNVAHSAGLALYAFTLTGPVGIDVEFMRELPEWERVAESAFSSLELERLRACPRERRGAEFFRAWTRQEAVLKALGVGLSGAAERGSESGYNVYPLQPEPRFAAALAAGPAGKWITLQRWPNDARAAGTYDAAPRRGRFPLENPAPIETTLP